MLAISSGQSILVDNHSYKITGVITYQQEDGSIYQEYFIADTRKENPFNSWIEYSEGTLIRYVTMDILHHSIPDYKTIKVGTSITMSGKEIFITTKSTSKVIHLDGSFPFELTNGEISQVIEGVYDGYIIALEFSEGQCEFSTGQVIPFPAKI